MENSSLPKVFAVVLNYNGKETILDCLRSIYASDYPNLEIIVVDNDSKDGSMELAKNAFPKAHWIRNSANIGFAAGNNIGIRFALEKFADYVFLLNNDAMIEKETISSLVAAAQKNPSVGIASPVIYKSANGPIWFAGGKILFGKMKATHDLTSQKNSVYPTQYASGCAMLIKKAVFKKIGLFDEKFFLYYEDVDFSHRAAKKDFEIVMVSGANAFHKEASEKNNPQKIYWLVISGLIFFKKSASPLMKIWLFIYLLLRKTKNRFALLRKDPLAVQVSKAYSDYKKYSRTQP